MLGIAAGNGTVSEGVNRGVAYESEILVVKMGNAGTNSFPQTTELMEGIDYLVRQAAALGKPLQSISALEIIMVHIRGIPCWKHTQQRGKRGAVCHLRGKWKQWKRPYPYRGKTAARAERDRGDEHRSL